MVVVDRFAGFFKLFTVGALAAVIVFVMSDLRERKHGVGEYYFLLLGAAVGIFFMVGTNNLLLLMSNRNYQTMISREGKEKLRDEALAEVRAVQKKEGSPDVDDLLFTSFVVQ